MNVAYGRALAAPVRTVYYNLTVTGLSVLGALLIGSIEICQVLSDRLDLDGAFWVWCQGLDFTQLGFGLVTLFVMVWALALSIWHFGRAARRRGHRIRA